MSDYIKRDALYEKAYWHGKLPDFDNPYPDGTEAVDVSDIDTIPSAPVVEVVHCKNCTKSYTPVAVPPGTDKPVVTARFCSLTNRMKRDDGYCDEGEKKDD